MRILVTGGAGFIGSNFIKLILKQKIIDKLINLDLLTYAGNLNNLKDINTNNKYVFIKGNIKNKKLIEFIFNKYKIEIIINFAAETHVDRSIKFPKIFFKTNIFGTQVLLDTALKYWNTSKNKFSYKYKNKMKFIQISTDEVYGSSYKNKLFTETDKLTPSSPYASSKAAADLIALSYYKTFNLPVIIIRSSNNYGKNQKLEKLIPLIINSCIKDIKIPIFGDGKNIRNWIYVIDNCNAISKILFNGKIGEIYNVCDINNNKTNIEIAKMIIKLLNKSNNLIKFVKDRPGHDKKYFIDSSKIIKKLNWYPKYSLKEGIKNTINWYIKNQNNL